MSTGKMKQVSHGNGPNFEPMAMNSAGAGRRFDLRGGDSSLDFVNTVAWTLTDRPIDYLGTYEDLLTWGVQAGVLALDEQEQLLARGLANSAEAQTALERVRALREVLHRMLIAAIARTPPDAADVTMFNRLLAEALSRQRVVHGRDDMYEWVWEWGGEPEYLLWRIARTAADLLASPRRGRVKVCAGPGCGWLFVDMSRNHSRRWCDSQDCGNRERVRSHLARKRASR